MADRITQAHLQSVFGRWIKAFGLRASKGYKDPGLFIEAGPMGGYRVSERFADTSGTADPITSDLKSARELYDCLVFAFRSVDFKKHRRANPRPYARG